MDFILWGIIGGLIFGSIITMMQVKKHKPVEKAKHADYYIKDGDAKMSVAEDKYIRSTETKTKVNTSDTGNSKK